MKKTLIKMAFVAACLFTCFIACKKDKAAPAQNPAGDDNKPDPDTNKPDTAAYVKFAHGTPVGQGVTKSIGPAGGTIAMPDGRISVQIPAGALNSATEIKIQPVTNTLPMGSSEVTYKLTPENIHFSKPVAIKFNYNNDDLEGTTHDGMYVAFQDAAGHWFGKVKTVLDSVNKTLIVQTKHFSTWGKYRMFRIMSDHDTMQQGEKSKLFIIVIVTDKQTVDVESDNDLVAPIVEAKDYNTKKNFSGWKIRGKGTIKPMNENSEAEYTAPASITQESTVTAEVTISNLFDQQEPDRPGKSGKMILLKSIKLLPVKFDLYVNGQKVTLSDITSSSNGKNMVLKAKNGSKEIQVTINAVGIGQFSYQLMGGEIAPNKAVMYYDHTDGVRYLCSTLKCPESGPVENVIAPGTFNITDWGEYRHRVAGKFETELYALDPKAPIPCRNPKMISIKGEFAFSRKY